MPLVSRVNVGSAEYSKVAESYIPNIPADKYPYLNRLTHHIIEGNYDGIHDFEFGLELILNGLEQFRYNV
jgi:Tetracyclin repressor-like, C-terminal domain